MERRQRFDASFGFFKKFSLLIGDGFFSRFGKVPIDAHVK
jgi:hypothetical protein